MEDLTPFGRILSTNNAECVAGYRVSENTIPQFGSLVRVPMSSGLNLYGLITDIQIEEDNFLRQVASSSELTDEVLQDTRNNRNVPIVIRILFTGYKDDGRIYHLLPPHPPLSLDDIFICDMSEIAEFTSAGHFGYLRHILRAVNIPISELLAAHVRQTAKAQQACGNQSWTKDAIQELITLLRDDYPVLINVLGALADADVFCEFGSGVNVTEV